MDAGVALSLTNIRSLQASGGDLELLLWMGERLDFTAAVFDGETLGMWLAKTLLRVRDKNGDIVPLVANRVQREFEQKRGKQNIVLKARQMGVSTWVAGRFFLKTISRPGTLTVQIAQSREAAEKIFRIVHRFYEQLPEGLRDGILRVSRANAGQLQFAELDSEYRVESAADLNAGRGMTIQNLHCSEIAHWGKDAAATLAGLRAALSPTGELVLESTPNGAHGCFYEEWQRATETGTVRHFFPWWIEEAYRGVPIAESDWSEDERRLVVEQGLSAEQIGYRRQLRASFGMLAQQEYAEDADECFLASGNCVFNLANIERRMKEIREPLLRRKNDQLWIWYPPQPGKRYIAGIDASGGGVDGDYAAVQIVERETGLQCAEFRGHLDPRELAIAAAELGREYSQALMVVERNNHGAAVLLHLEQGERYPAIYEQQGQPGWLTNVLSRPLMIEALGITLDQRPEIFSSSRLLAECRTFVRQQDGRSGAASGSHDDCVMAIAMALQVRLELKGPCAEVR
jgi:hypothetical protein